VITDRDGEMLHLEADHCRHAVVENAIRDLKDGVALDHLPSGRFGANGAWLGFNVMPYNVARWMSRVALGEALVTTTTLRARHVAVPGWLVHHAPPASARTLALGGAVPDSAGVLALTSRGRLHARVTGGRAPRSDPSGAPSRRARRQSTLAPRKRVNHHCVRDTVREARVLYADWRDRYNRHHPHSSLGWMTPAAVAQLPSPGTTALPQGRSIYPLRTLTEGGPTNGVRSPG
jgi:Integrase core domain